MNSPSSLAVPHGKPVKPKFTIRVTRADGSTFETEVVGRTAWATLALLQAGGRGCTPLQRPAPRWSDYIFRLRGQGVSVETVDEKHGGAYAGEHAKYVLRDRVSIAGWGNLVEFLASPAGREFAGMERILLGEVVA